MLYLRAQVELEGFAGLQNYLRAVVKALEATGAPKIISVRSEIKKTKCSLKKYTIWLQFWSQNWQKGLQKQLSFSKSVTLYVLFSIANQTLLSSATLEQV